MPCCGGKKGGKPIGRVQYFVGRVLFTGVRVTIAVFLRGAGLLSPRFRDIARFWALISADWQRAIARREGIVFHEEAEDGLCPLPPTHGTTTAGDARFESRFGDETFLPEELEAGEPPAAVVRAGGASDARNAQPPAVRPPA